jgi:gliding motility-associated-like protein
MIGFLISGAVVGQNYIANGDARSIGNGCFQLTDNEQWENGSVWYSDKLDLTRDFNLEFSLNLGALDGNGADGMVFVLQTAGVKALGISGGDMGFSGFSPSFGVEFDTWVNTDKNDPNYDHMAFVLDGSVTHQTGNALLAPVATLPSTGNVEDNEYHQVKVEWDASDNRMKVYFDCELRLNQSYDLVDEVFNGTTSVYWGFTSATGGSFNEHKACLSASVTYLKEYDVCIGDDVRLVTKESDINTYEWTPGTYLNSAIVQRPLCTPKDTTQYIAKSTNACGDVNIDTITVNVIFPNEFDLGPGDTLLCNGEVYPVDLTGNFVDTFYWDDGVRDSVRTFDAEGQYSVAGLSKNCFHRDTLIVYQDVTPMVGLRADTTICEGDSVFVIPNLSHPDSVWMWSDGFISQNRWLGVGGTYSISNTNGCGTDQDTFILTTRPTPVFSLGQDTFYCPGESIVIRPDVVNGNWTLLWSDGSTSDSLVVDQAADFWLRTETPEGCDFQDSIQVSGLTLPRIDLPDSIVHCEGEEYVFEYGFEDADVFWNGVRTDTFRVVDFTGNLMVEVSNFCGTEVDVAHISLEECKCDVWVPNAFTPSDDLLNESFVPVTECNLKSYQLEVFNRWGEKVYQSDQWGENWDGRVKGRLVENSYFIWKMEYTARFQGSIQRFVRSGVVYVLK